jgi:hypothetical protein
MSYEFQRTEKMPDELRRLVEQLNPFQKKYCEYRSKGLSKADAAKSAGSKSKNRKSLSKIGYIIERENEGAKDYIEWLISVRATTAMVDSIEIVEKMRRIYDDAILDGKYNDAVKAAYYLGEMIGIFDKNPLTNPKAVGENLRENKKTKNDVDAFKEEGESPDERIQRLSHLIKEIGKQSKQ